MQEISKLQNSTDSCPVHEKLQNCCNCSCKCKYKTTPSFSLSAVPNGYCTCRNKLPSCTEHIHRPIGRRRSLAPVSPSSSPLRSGLVPIPPTLSHLPIPGMQPCTRDHNINNNTLTMASFVVHVVGRFGMYSEGNLR